MLSNFHTHTTYCDGKSTCEEVVLSAIKKGFSAIGFSGHAYTDFDLSYCMKDTDAYISELKALKEKYKEKVKVYVGVEEDAFCLVDRTRFDYVIGSCHYSFKEGIYYPVDFSVEEFENCLNAWQGDTLAFARDYYANFCDYILRRRPDVIGHFDLITKFDEVGESRFLNNPEYIKLSEEFVRIALSSACPFEVNTGAITRGYRTTPYPNENLLHIIKKEGGKIVLSSDSHHADTIDFNFDETKAYLKDIGFKSLYALSDSGLLEYFI